MREFSLWSRILITSVSIFALSGWRLRPRTNLRVHVL